MKVTIKKSFEEFTVESAQCIVSQIIENPESHVGFSTGRTTTGIHSALLDIYRKKAFDITKVKIFAVDEITNMSRDCKASCYWLIYNQIVKPLGIPLENFIMPDPLAEDLDNECLVFKNKVCGENAADFQMLGIGENGHLGFNQPGTPFGTSVWVSIMDDSLDERIRRENNISSDVKLGGLTLGIKDIMRSKKIVLAANGKSKAEIVKKALEGPVTESLPASVLQLHPNCEFILDAEAASFI